MSYWNEEKYRKDPRSFLSSDRARIVALYASLDVSIDGSEWGVDVERCKKIQIERKPIFFDSRGCERADAESWWEE